MGIVQQAIHHERKRRKLGVRKLADELGVSHQTLYNAINGVGQPSYKLLKALGLVNTARAKQ
jgi:transcriptional regulator with XRE-family HTH domain